MAGIMSRLTRSHCVMDGPRWRIFRQGTKIPVAWMNHVPNMRFAVYDPGEDSDPADPVALSDDLVLDRETGLVWARDANLFGEQNWQDSNSLCRELDLGNRYGWRLPTVEELSSLIEPRQPNLALPLGHPFINVQYGSGLPAYWTCTNCENPTGAAWFVNFWAGSGPQRTGLQNKTLMGFVWPVRGETGGSNWNW